MLRPFVILATLAIAPPAIGPPAHAAPPQTVGRIIWPALGMSVAQVKAVGAWCSDEVCEFEHQTPQQLCPSVGHCQGLKLIIQAARVAGYITTLSKEDLVQSSNASVLYFGPPKKETVDVDKMRTAYFSWKLQSGQTLMYSETTGLDMYGSVLDVQQIWLMPAG